MSQLTVTAQSICACGHTAEHHRLLVPARRGGYRAKAYNAKTAGKAGGLHEVTWDER